MVTEGRVKKPEVTEPGFRWCGRCQTLKTESEFGAHGWCRICLSTYRLKQRGLDADAIRTRATDLALHGIGFHRCTKCHRIKGLTSEFFNKKEESRTGFKTQCRLCLGARDDLIKKPKIVPPGCKWCGRCKKLLPEAEFSATTSQNCRDCVATNDFKRRGLDDDTIRVKIATKATTQKLDLALAKIGFRRCTKCQKSKELTSEMFFKATGGLTKTGRRIGFQTQCKLCATVWEKMWRKRPDVAARLRLRRRLNSLRLRGGPVEIAGRSADWGVVERLLLDAWREKCCYCAAPYATIDHLVPLKPRQGPAGTNNIRNLVPACVSCNSRKNTKSVTDFIGPLGARILTERAEVIAADIEEKIRVTTF